MKKISILWFSLKELKHNFVMLLISFLLLTSILTAAFFVSVASSDLIGSFFDYISSSSYKTSGEKGFSFTLNGLQYTALDTVSDLPFISVIPDDIMVRSSDFYYNGNELGDHNIMAHYPNPKEKIRIISGTDLTKEVIDSELIWISEQFSEETNCKTGDIIANNISSNLTVEYKVAGIFEGDDDIDAFLPFGTYYKTMEKAGFYIETTMTGTISDVANYKKMSAELKKRGIHSESNYDEEIKAITLMDLLLQALFVVVVIAGIWTFSNLCSIILNNRKRFIIHLQILGMKPIQALSVYGFIIIAISMLAFLLAILFSNIFSVYIIDLAKKIYPELGKMEVNIASQLVKGIVVFLITICLVLVRSYKNIRSTELISQLSEVQ